MKTLASNTVRYIGILCLAIALIITGSVNTIYAQGKAYKKLAHNPDVVAPKSLEVAVYQLDNTLKFKMHFDNHTNKDVIIKIRNSNKKVVYQEVVSASKYIRKFDFTTLADGDYTFEVSNTKEKFVKEISLQTLSARSLNISE